MSAKEYQDNRTRLIHAANTARLTGFNRDITLYFSGNEEQREGSREWRMKGNEGEEEREEVGGGEGEGEEEGSRERRVNESNNNNNNDIIHSNNEGENMNSKERDYNNDDVLIERSQNENVDKESSSNNLLKKCKLRMSSSSSHSSPSPFLSSSAPFSPSSFSPSLSSSTSSRRFDLSKAYSDLLCDQNNLRRSQGMFLRNVPPKKETFRRSQSCPRKVENGYEMKNENENENENKNKTESGNKDENEYEYENENGRIDGRQNIRNDEDRNDYNRAGRTVEREYEGSGRRYKSEERISARSSVRGRGREGGNFPGYENENNYDNENENQSRQVEVAVGSVKRGRAIVPSKKVHVPYVQHKQHVQSVRPASLSATKDSRRKNATWLSTSISQPAPHTPHYTGNHYPLRTSTSTRLLSGQYPINLTGRNAFSIPYIIPESQPFNQNTLTNAVEKVVTDFFR